MISKIRKFFSIIPLNLRFQYLGACILILCGSYFTTIISVKLGEVLDDISSGKINSLLSASHSIYVLAAVYLLSIIFNTIRFTLLTKVNLKSESILKDICIKKIISCPVSYHEECLSGQRTSQIARGISAFSQVTRMFFNGVFFALFMVCFSLYEILKHAPTLMMQIVLVYAVIYFAISFIYARYAKEINKIIVNLGNEFSGQTSEVIQNIEFIRAANAFNFESNRLKGKIDDIYKYGLKNNIYWGILKILKGIIETLCLISLIVISCFYIEKGQMLAGSAVAVCLLFRRLTTSLEPLSFYATNIISYLIEIEGLVDLLTINKDNVLSIESTKATCNDNNFIEFKDLIIANPKKDKLLAKYNHIVLDVSKITALKGVTGSGKTTLIRALNRYYPILSGSITIFGKDINNFSHSELTNLIYYTPQSSLFFKGTLKENFIYGIEENVSDEKLIEILKKMCLVGNSNNDEKGREIETENKILNYQLLEGASNLSGGQKQRLLLARAFLKKPKVFIFDESSANIDEETSNVVLTNIENYAKSIGAGIVYISHDANVISRCDEVVDIKNEVLGIKGIKVNDKENFEVKKLLKSKRFTKVNYALRLASTIFSIK